MRVLPIRFLNLEDKAVFGEELINLAYLQRLGIPVASGYAVLPPAGIISKACRGFSKSGLQALKEEFKKNPYTEELFESVKDKKVTKKIWNDLLDKWFIALEQELEKGDRPNYNKIKLYPQPVYLTDDIKASGAAYIDKNRNFVEVRVEEGLLEPGQFRILEDIIVRANSKLLLDYLFDWVLEGKEFKLTKLRPFTQNHDIKTEVSYRLPEASVGKEYIDSTVFKIMKMSDFDDSGWIFVDTPQALQNMKEFEGRGEGFLIDLDKIYTLVTGSEDTGIIDPKILKDFFYDNVKEIVKQNIPVMFRGESVTEDTVLRFLIKLGVKGVVLEEDMKPGFNDYIRQLEHLHLNQILD